MPVIFAAYAVRLTETLTAPPLLPRSASSSSSGTLGAVHVRCGAHEPQIAWQRGSWLVDDASGRTLAGYDVCAAVCPQLHGGGAFGGALCYVDGREYARPALAAAELPLDDDEAPAVEVRCGSADARPLSIAAAEALMPSARAALAGRPLERAARDYAVCQAACVRVPPTTNGSAHAEAWPRPARRRGDAPPFRYVELALSHHMGGAEAAVLVRLPAALAAQSLVGSPECFRSDADADADADAAAAPVPNTATYNALLFGCRSARRPLLARGLLRRMRRRRLVPDARTCTALLVTLGDAHEGAAAVALLDELLSAYGAAIVPSVALFNAAIGSCANAKLKRRDVAALPPAERATAERAGAALMLAVATELLAALCAAPHGTVEAGVAATLRGAATRGASEAERADAARKAARARPSPSSRATQCSASLRSMPIGSEMR